MKKTLFTAALSLAAIGLMNAANPYLPLWEFIPDGEPYVFEDPDNPGQFRVYVYGSHDNLITQYCGRDQVVWSASVNDLNHWRYDGTIFENKVNANGEPLYADNVGDVLYAPDVTLVTDANGKKTYYLYPNVQHDLRAGLIAKSDRPDGPFVVCNWDPKDANKTTGILRFDPGVFVDDDGHVYGYWGFERSYAAELDPETMCTVKKGTPIIEDMVSGRYQEGEFRFFEASSIRKIQDKYVFIYSRWAQNGEWGLPETNYTLAYAWSNSPLGPWTYGGTIIDGRGREQMSDGTWQITATPTGNTHGSICEINGQWWVFYHRQAGTNEYSRQAMVAPIEVEVKAGADGWVKISEGEFTSEGFETSGLNPFETHAAGIACYMVGPEPAHQEYPNVIYPGSHTEIHRLETPYDPVEDPNPYTNNNHCDIVNNVDGSVVGYKYIDFNELGKCSWPLLTVCLQPKNVKGQMEVWLDRPGEQQIVTGSSADGQPILSPKGTLLATYEFNGEPSFFACANLPVGNVKGLSGKHALFFVFKSEVKNQSLADLYSFEFVDDFSQTFYVWSTKYHFPTCLISVLFIFSILYFLLKKKRKK